MALQYRKAEDIRPNDHLTCLVYGTWGSGKTHFARTWPAPLFLSTDNQLMGLRDTKVDFVDIQTWDDLLQALVDAGQGKARFGEEPKIETIVLDGISEVSELICSSLAGPGGKMDGKWPAAADRLRMLMKQFISLQKKYNLVMTAKVTIDKDENTGEILGAPETIGKMRTLIGGMFGIVLFAEQVTEFDPTAKAMRPKWVLNTIRKGPYPAIDRTGKLGVAEPNDFKVIQSKVLGV